MTSRIARIFFLIPVLLALSVSLALAQGGVTRVDNNDPSITYSGNWYSNSNSAHIGGVAALTNTGARGRRLPSPEPASRGSASQTGGPDWPRYTSTGT